LTVVLTVTCDRCDDEITADRTLLRVESGPLRPRREAIELCDEGLDVDHRRTCYKGPERSIAMIRPERVAYLENGLRVSPPRNPG
jgi:hypothetical protein